MLTNDAIPFWTAVAALAAAGSAVMAAIYTFLTFRLVRVQAEPKVIVYVKHDLERPSILMITIQNIGHDIAYDVHFKASRPIPKKAWGLIPRDDSPVEYMNDGPLVEGIPALAPGDYREIDWGQYGGLSKAVGDQPVTLDYTYRAGKRIVPGRAQLDVLSFLGTNANEKPPVQIARSLKDLTNSVKQIQGLLQALLTSVKQPADQDSQSPPGQSTDPE